jgi:sortase A
VTATERDWKPTVARSRIDAAAVARVSGKTLLGVGLFLIGFVAYELFVTSVFARRAQDGLTAELDQRIASVSTEVVPYTPGVLPEAPIQVSAELVATAPPVEAVTSDPVVTELPGEELPGEVLPVEAAIVTEPLPPAGNAIGRIIIPAADVDWTVVEGVGPSDLRTGAGHMPDTALPGQPGNAVISGHRTTYGAPFYHLNRVRPGDPITVTTATGRHVYQVVEKRVVEPNDTWVTGQWDGAWLTLTTCNPRFSSRERLVVFAQLVGGPNAEAIGGSS